MTSRWTHLTPRLKLVTFGLDMVCIMNSVWPGCTCFDILWLLLECSMLTLDEKSRVSSTGTAVRFCTAYE